MAETINGSFVKQLPANMQITFEEFKSAVEEKYGWEYNQVQRTFTYYFRGEKYYVDEIKLRLIAMHYHYGGDF